MGQVFEQQERESNRAYAAFRAYLDLGPHRTLAATAAKVGKSVKLMERWSSRHEWTVRVQAYAAHLATLEREAAEAMMRVQGVDWAKRQEALREEEWELHEECIRAAKQGLKEFYEQKKAPRLGEIVKLLELASKLWRLATNLATDKTEVTGEAGGAIRVELDLALKKIYGRPLPGEVVDVAEVKREEGRPAGRGLPALPQEGSHRGAGVNC